LQGRFDASDNKWDHSPKGPSIEMHLNYADGATLSFWAAHSSTTDTIRLSLIEDPSAVDLFVPFDSTREAARVRAVFPPGAKDK